MKKWAAEKGITIETTAPYLPSQNGVAERLNRTLLEMARAMIIAKGLLLQFFTLQYTFLSPFLSFSQA